MKKTKVLYENGFYLFESKVAANSNYIENLNEAKQLLIYARYYLKNHLKIYDYVITRHGWQMLVKLNSAKNIEEPKEIEFWRSISERVRLFISTYVKRVNTLRNRKGVLVQSKYERYYFETLTEATIHLNRMRNQQVKLYQRKKKYRGIKKHFRIGKDCQKGSIFLCSKELRTKKSDFNKEVGSDILWGVTDFVAPNLIFSTLLSHQTTKTHSTKQNSS